MSASTRHLAGFTLAALTLALALQLALAPRPFGLQPAAPPALPPAAVGAEGLARAHTASGDYWTLYFSSPLRGTVARNGGDLSPQRFMLEPAKVPVRRSGGIDAPLAAAIDAAQVSLDIAAFELNNPLLAGAILDAAERGLRVRVVSDDEHGLRASDGLITALRAAGIPVVDDGRSALMHNKFVIIDDLSVWTGSMNLTVNGADRHNNNLLQLRSAEAARRYQAEFDEMFVQGRFGPRSPRGDTMPFEEGTARIALHFGPEDEPAAALYDALAEAQERIRFMAFSFTLDDIGSLLLRQAAAGLQLQGIFERVGSESVWSELGPLHCAGLDLRQDGNPYLLHHKVFLIDDDVVVTGSANFSASGTQSNDENMLIIEDAALAAAYQAEFARRWDEASTPREIACS
ncbi:MAG: phospholipase D-like domain-containing protein [Anaerolineaceae bacterium]|nr:phospholipase D-like domain-containing protein [Anaerolineaceae bacterium]